MKKNLLVLLIAFVLFYMNGFAQYGGGNGTPDDPFLLSQPDHLTYLSTHQSEWSKNSSFKLTTDIDMTGVTFTPIGNSNNVFKGNLDGNHHVISNLTITGTGQTDGAGLFGSIRGNITQLGLINPSYLEGQYTRVGAIAGILDGGTISYCYAKGGTIDVGNHGWAGGIVGVLFAGGDKTVEDCYSSVNMIGSWGMGGVVGVNRGEHTINRVAFYNSISGASWKKIATNISDDLDVGRILIHPNNPDRIVIATGHGMFLSTDAGETWNPGNAGLPNNLPKDLAAYYNPDTEEYILYTLEQSVYTESGNTIATKGGVYKSTDDGETWIKINKGLGQPDKMVDIELDPTNESILWAAAWGSGWYKAIIPDDIQSGGETGINDVEMSDFQAYPNPVRDQLFIRNKVADFKMMNATILSVSGQVLKMWNQLPLEI